MNLRLKEEFILSLSTNLGMPIILKKGIVGLLKVIIPWSKILSSPITLYLSDLIIVCSTTGQYNPSYF